MAPLGVAGDRWDKHDELGDEHDADRDDKTTRPAIAPGKRTITSALRGAAPKPRRSLDPDAAREAASSSRGEPLPDELRESFGASLGVDLSSVRAHSDEAAASATRAVRAKAFASGADIFFANGAYDPHSSGGRELIAHEVAHTVQQRGGPGGIQTRSEISEPGDALEREADSAAAAMIAGRQLAQPLSRGAGIQRSPEDDEEGQGDEAGGAASALDDPSGGPWTEEEIRQLATEEPATVFDTIANRDSANAVRLLHTIGRWEELVQRIPRGASCPQELRAAMYRLIHIRAIPQTDVPHFFHARFDISYQRVFDAGQSGGAPEQGGGASSQAGRQFAGGLNYEVLDRVWWQLDRLPDNDVSENAGLRIVRMSAQGLSGGAPATHDPDNDVATFDEDGEFEEDPNSSHSVEGLVRHEVGHAVADRMGARANNWLRDQVRFITEPVSATAVRNIIISYGGFPATYRSGESEAPFTPALQQGIIDSIVTFLTSGRGGFLTFSDPQQQQASTALPNGVMGTFMRTSNMHLQTTRPDLAGTYHAFSDHYTALLHAGPLVAAMITATGRDYAGSAPQEFFAECYVEYYSDPSSIRNPATRGGALPAAIKTWFDANVPAPPRGGATRQSPAGPGGAT